ncbi:SMI1/KNR4 family protein [Devosia soli]|uniref:SMI1/KNR4 family protein n=1 Tax=Devosia soli TaxID=361041 RepID=UPI00069C3E35|nr:SMI1/KNR4 family protein [Devosia soli]
MISAGEQWRAVLESFCPLILRSEDYGHLISASQRCSGWLGHHGASEERIAELEKRLGAPLPPSYRNFLIITDGWGPISPFIDRLFSTDEVDWLSNSEPDMLKAMAAVTGASVELEWPVRAVQSIMQRQDYDVPRETYDWSVDELAATLKISEEGDAAMLLLNPRIQCHGEWEAWFFAHWLPGAQRYPSFFDLVQDQYRQMRDGVY